MEGKCEQKKRHFKELKLLLFGTTLAMALAYRMGKMFL